MCKIKRGGTIRFRRLVRRKDSGVARRMGAGTRSTLVCVSVGIKLAQRLHGLHSCAACCLFVCLFVVCHAGHDQTSKQTTRGRHSLYEPTTIDLQSINQSSISTRCNDRYLIHPLPIAVSTLISGCYTTDWQDILCTGNLSARL